MRINQADHRVGAKIGGKIVSKWACWDTSSYRDTCELVSRVVIDFTDGTYVFAESVVPIKPVYGPIGPL